MKNLKLSYSIFLIIMSLFLLAGGPQATPPNAANISITSLGWYYENIDPSFWNAPPSNGQTAYYDFFIHYEGNIAFSDISYARVYLPDHSYWTINIDSTYLNTQYSYIGGYGRWYSNQLDVLPIGALQVEVRLTNGVDSKYTAQIPAPGGTTTGTATTMYSQDLSSPPANSAPMVLRATIGTGNTLTTSTSTIVIKFSVTDSKVYDGYVWFFDASNNYLGGFFRFRNPSTGAICSQLSGSSLNINGTNNTLTLKPTDLTLNQGATFSQIAKFFLVLTDGYQYGVQSNGLAIYDGRSISAFTSLTIQ
jgi:hypothetical protein